MTAIAMPTGNPEKDRAWNHIVLRRIAAFFHDMTPDEETFAADYVLWSCGQSWGFLPEPVRLAILAVRDGPDRDFEIVEIVREHLEMDRSENCSTNRMYPGIVAIFSRKALPADWTGHATTSAGIVIRARERWLRQAAHAIRTDRETPVWSWRRLMAQPSFWHRLRRFLRAETI